MSAAQSGRPMTILLYGPPFGRAVAGAYGGGVGGYARNMEVYLSSLYLDDVTFKPLFHTVRGERGGVLGSFPLRMVVDCWRILTGIIGSRPNAVHVLASYRKALPRELFLAIVCRILGVPFVYDIKAGAFVSAYESGGGAYRAALAFILRNARAVLVEGRAYQAFLRKTFGIESTYFPNFVPAREVPPQSPARLTGEVLTVLYAGYCYEGKGVRSLLDGCALAARSGTPIAVTLIGEEPPAFTAFCDAFEAPALMTVWRLGRRPHAEVLAAMQAHDIYCYPSAHSGEGHNNSINEAMMCGMVILATRHGFLPDVLPEDAGWLFGSATAEEIGNGLIEISRNRPHARRKAAAAHCRLAAEFTSVQANHRLHAAYAPVLTIAPPATADPVRPVAR
jgi:glycosyltransferase involved in cell wall biosynthesis